MRVCGRGLADAEAQDETIACLSAWGAHRWPLAGEAELRPGLTALVRGERTTKYPQNRENCGGKKCKNC